MSDKERATIMGLVLACLTLVIGYWAGYNSRVDFSPSDWMACEPAMVERAGAPALAMRCHRDTVVVLVDSIPLPPRPPVRLPVRPQS